MAGHGFIHDKLDIKFLILYIAARVIEPVPFDTMLDLTLCDDAIDYFDFSECLSDLVKTEHLTLSDDDQYAITEKGRRNSQICESSLPFSVRQRCDKNLEVCNRRLRRMSQVRAEYSPRPNGTFTVSLALDDDMGSVMALELMMVSQEMAKAVADRFRKAPEKLHSQIVELLLASEAPAPQETQAAAPSQEPQAAPEAAASQESLAPQAAEPTTDAPGAPA